MELRQLQHFVAVAEEESFTRAAVRLGYVQSALSVSIQGLERELAVRLFDRSTHRVRLSDAGRVLLPYARGTLNAAEEVRNQAAAVGNVVRGTLRLGIMQAFGFLDVPRLLGRFHRAHPEVEIVMRPSAGGSVALLEALARNELDLAFTGVDRSPTGVDTLALGSEELFLACLPELAPGGRGAVPLQSLAGEALVDFPAGWGVRSVLDRAFAAAGIPRRIGIEVADVRSCLALVREGLGRAVVPRSILSEQDTSLELRPLAPRLEWTVALATRAGHPPSPAAAAFIELMALERAD